MSTPLLKNRLEEERRRLRTAHRRGASGFDLSRRLCRFWDQTLTRLFEQSGARSDGPALLATGSLGRFQLSPWSDIDFILLIPENAQEGALESVAEAILYPVWDAGVKTGHQARTASECLTLCREDPQILTALLDARFLTGDRAAAENLLRAFDDLLTGGGIKPTVPRAVPSPVEEGYPQTVHVLEPNIKESPGGLRDFQIAAWTAQIRFGRRIWKEALQKSGVLTRVGWIELTQAVDFLLRLRHECHFRARGFSDKLLVSIQPEAAILMGYQGAGEAEAAKALLKDYFQAAARVERFLLGIVEIAEENLYVPRDDIIRGARVNGEMLELPDHLAAELGRDGRAIFDLFAKLAGTGLFVSERSRKVLAPLAAVVNDEFREDESTAGAFIALLKKERAVDALRALHSVGLLDAYLPPFGAMRGLVPYDVFHSFPADVHTLMALDFFDNLRTGMGPDSLVKAAREIERPDLMRLALLLHDTGKVGGPGHVDRGARMAPVVCLRLGLSDEETAFVVRLVREHESLSHAAHTRDVEDPGLSGELAERMKDAEGLRALFVFTYCDMRAVGPGIWTDWRAGLIEGLYQRALEVLTKENPREDVEKKLDTIRQSVNACARAQIVDSYFRQMKKRHPYSLSARSAEMHLKTLELYHREKAPLIKIFPDDDIPLTEGDAVVCAPDVRGFLAGVAGVFAAERLNILGVEAMGTQDDLALDTVRFVVRGEPVPKAALESRLSKILRDVVSGAADIEKILEESDKKIVSSGSVPLVATEVRIDNHCSEKQTVVEVWTADRTGLLYRIAKALYDFGLNVTMARVNTIAGRAVDSFYVVGEDGGKITGRNAQRLRFEVQRALAR